MTALVIGVMAAAGARAGAEPSAPAKPETPPARVVLVTGTLPAACEGRDYRPVLLASGASRVRVVAGTLPPGLAIEDDGRLHGRLPAGTAGAWRFSVRASDDRGDTADASYVLRVLPAGAAQE